MKIINLFTVIFSISIVTALNAMDAPSDWDTKHNLCSGSSESEESQEEIVFDGESDLLDSQIEDQEIADAPSAPAEEHGIPQIPIIEDQPTSAASTGVRNRIVRQPMATVLAQQAQETQSIQDAEVDLNDLTTYFSNMKFDPYCVACCWPKDDCTCLQVVDYISNIWTPCMVCDKRPCICERNNGK